MTPTSYRLTRRGLLLPLVLVVMLLVFTLAATLQQAAWRSSRGAQSQWDAQQASYLADAAVVRTIAAWASDTAAATAIGSPVVRETFFANGWRAQATTMRTGPLRAVVLGRAGRDRADGLGGIDGLRVERIVSRTVQLSPPSLPLFGAATILGAATLGSALIDGRDVIAAYNPARDDCGPTRDTSSIAALVARSIVPRGAPTLYGAALTAPIVQLTVGQTQFDAAFAQLRRRSTATVLTAGNTVARQPAWRALVIRDTTAVTLQGRSDHVGLLVVDGDLVLRGSLVVDGALVVRGALDAGGGALTVRGALIVRDSAGTGSVLGDSVDVRYAPCLVGRAMAAVAVVRAGRFAIWNSP